MMNVNLSLTAKEIELLNVSLRVNVREMETLANAESLGEKTCEEYREKLRMIPRILEVLTTLQVKRMMYDYGCQDSVTV